MRTCKNPQNGMHRGTPKRLQPLFPVRCVVHVSGPFPVLAGLSLRPLFRSCDGRGVCSLHSVSDFPLVSLPCAEGLSRHPAKIRDFSLARDSGRGGYCGRFSKTAESHRASTDHGVYFCRCRLCLESLCVHSNNQQIVKWKLRGSDYPCQSVINLGI